MDWKWDSERLFFEGDGYFAALIEGLRGAQVSVDFETYIYSHDEIGLEVESALIKAAHRGVKVRLLVDGIGASGWYEKRGPLLAANGIAVHVYHPVYVSRVIAYFLRNFGLNRRRLRTERNLFSRLNRRTHRKMCLIDGQKAFIGSLNVSASHSERARGAEAWRDTAALVTGSSVAELKGAFDHAWIRARPVPASGSKSGARWRDRLLPFRRILRPRSPLIRLNYTSRLRRQSFGDFIQRLGGAQRRVWITNAYLAPSVPVLRALVQAAERGIDVRLLVPRKSDVFFMPWVATAHYEPLLKGGVRIFEYLPRFLHAKSAMIDDWVIVGSSNMNRRSLLYDFEVDVVLLTQDSREALERRFLDDLRESAEVLPARARLGDRIAARVGRVITLLFKNWI